MFPRCLCLVVPQTLRVDRFPTFLVHRRPRAFSSYNMYTFVCTRVCVRVSCDRVIVWSCVRALVFTEWQFNVSFELLVAHAPTPGPSNSTLSNVATCLSVRGQPVCSFVCFRFLFQFLLFCFFSFLSFWFVSFDSITIYIQCTNARGGEDPRRAFRRGCIDDFRRRNWAWPMSAKNVSSLGSRGSSSTHRDTALLCFRAISLECIPIVSWSPRVTSHRNAVRSPISTTVLVTDRARRNLQLEKRRTRFEVSRGFSRAKDLSRVLHVVPEIGKILREFQTFVELSRVFHTRNIFRTSIFRRF